ncbi:MAG: hypothetical protein NTU89_01995 [Candidatus Dependentiae bacterium]|nr:hypothetical protein [Candidatus Dependentiae bacterium]
MLKSMFVAALSSSWVVKASEESESYADRAESFGDEILEGVESLPERMEMGWKDSVMAHWDMMPSWQKVVVVVVLALGAFWLVCKLMKSGKGGCCKGE